MAREMDEAAQRLIDWHFRTEPELREVWMFTGQDDTSAEPIIELLEVNAATPATGSVDTFSFPPAGDIPYRTVIAEVTPEEFEQIRRQPSRLPRGWDLSKAQRFERPKAA